MTRIKEMQTLNCLYVNRNKVCFTFSLSEDRDPSIVGFWGQSIRQSQIASHRSPHRWHRSSCSWKRSSQPETEVRQGCRNHNMYRKVHCGKWMSWSEFCLISTIVLQPHGHFSYIVAFVWHTFMKMITIWCERPKAGNNWRRKGKRFFLEDKFCKNILKSIFLALSALILLVDK